VIESFRCSTAVPKCHCATQGWAASGLAHLRLVFRTRLLHRQRLQSLAGERRGSFAGCCHRRAQPFER
jgi:hypothetical protein